MCYDLEFTAAFASDDDAFTASVFCWVINLKCKLHGGGNALKWGSWQLHTPDILKDVHICLKSLISGSEALHNHIDQFVVTCMGFEDQTLAADEIKILWLQLHVDDDFMHEFTLLNPRFDGRVLWISSVYRDTPGILARVRALVQYSFRWINFSDTRWGATGPCVELLRTTKEITFIKHTHKHTLTNTIRIHKQYTIH